MVAHEGLLQWLERTAPYNELVEIVSLLNPNTFFVGGAVRNHLMDLPPEIVADVDFICADGLPSIAWEELEVVAATSRTPFGNPSLTLCKGGRVDLFPAATPTGTPVTLEQALGFCDASVNAIAVSAHNGQVVDPLGGRKDLRAGKARLIEACWATLPTEMYSMLLKPIGMQRVLGLGLDNVEFADHFRARIDVVVGSLPPAAQGVLADYDRWRREL
jgi:hypothetical protein